MSRLAQAVMGIGGILMITVSLWWSAVILAPPPFRYSAQSYDATPLRACPGVARQYTVRVTIDATADRPVIAHIVRSVWSVAGQRNVRQLPDSWLIYTSASNVNASTSFTPPADLPPGAYEYRVGRVVDDHAAGAYVVPFVVEECP